MKKVWTIRSQVVVLVAAITLPLTMLGVYTIVSEARLRARLAEQSALELADIVAGAVGQFLVDAEQTLAGMADRPSIRSLDPSTCGPFLEEVNHVLTQYVNLFLARSDGEPVCAALPPRGPDDAAVDAGWLRGARPAEGLTVGAPEFGEASGRWIVAMAVPVRSQSGELVAYLGASVDLGRFQSLLTTASLPPDGVITLSHVDGGVVARSADPATWIGQQLPRVDGGSRHAELGRGVQRAPGAEGIERVWGFHRIDGSDWMVYAGIPTRWVDAQVWRSAAATAIPGFGIVLLLTLLAASLYRRITGALAGLVEGTREAAAGGPPRSIPTEGPQEVIAVAEQFHRALSERDRAVKALNRSRERYRSILDNAVIGIYVSTRDGRLLEANPAMARMLGYESVGELLRMRMERLYADQRARDRIIAEATAGRSAGAAEVEWVRRDGTALSVRLHWNRIDVPEVGPAFEVLAEDLTERKALEERLRGAQKLEAVARLAGGVAHDFNNRLTVIQGQAQLLELDLAEGSPLRQNVEAILESSDRAASLTRQLLAFGRKQIGRPRLLDVNEVVDRLARVLHRILGEDVRLRLALAEERAPVHVDPGQIEQILLNLCTNARDAMPQGGRLVLRTSLREVRPGAGPSGLDPGPYVVLSVCDTGHGMDEEVRSRIFEPFFTTKPPGTGSGLGLSTVYGLVHQNRGHIELETSPGKGTTFHVWLPRAHGTPDVLEVPERHADSPRPRADVRSTVLVAEDEDSVREVVLRALGRAGYRVLEARDGDDALRVEAAHPGSIHLLLTDVVMPGMRGQELALRISDRRPGIRVLFVSGYSERAPTTGSDGAGIQDFLPKPFTPDQLLRRVSEILEV